MPPPLQCPACRHPLSLPNSLRGQVVACSHCRATFRVPTEPGRPAVLAPPPPPPPPRPAAPVAGPVTVDVEPVAAAGGPVAPHLAGRVDPMAFDFDEGKADLGYQRVRLQTTVGGAVNLLRGGVISDLLFSFVIFAMSLYQAFRGHPLSVIVLTPLMVFLLYVPLVFVGLGLRALQRQSSRSQAQTGAVVALSVSGLMVVPVLWMAVWMHEALNQGQLELGIVSLLGFGSALGGSISGCLGGIKVLGLLHHPEVSRAFDEAERRAAQM
jgi:hypothetical protein